MKTMCLFSNALTLQNYKSTLLLLQAFLVNIEHVLKPIPTDKNNKIFYSTITK